MEYTIINGGLAVADIKVTFVSTASTVLIGDISKISLYSAFEGPPETVIVGVTLPTVPILPTIE